MTAWRLLLLLNKIATLEADLTIEPFSETEADTEETKAEEDEPTPSTLLQLGREKPRIGITIGDMNGVGIEIMLKTFADARLFDFCTPIIYGSSRAISYHRKVLKLDEFNYNIIPQADRAQAGVLNVLNCWNDEVPITIGRPNKIMGHYAFRALEVATCDLRNGKLDALVTGPVNKNLVNSDTTPFKGHTEIWPTNLAAEKA